MGVDHADALHVLLGCEHEFMINDVVGCEANAVERRGGVQVALHGCHTERAKARRGARE